MTLVETSTKPQHIILQNIRSLSRNYDQFKVLLTQLQEPMAICLTETWLNENHNSNCFNFVNFKDMEICSRKKRGGGVAIYINKCYEHEKVSSIEINSMQIITVKIKQYSDNLFLSCLYIPPSCVSDETFIRLENYLNNLILGPTEKHILCGDFNVNFLIKSKNSTKLRNLLLGSNLNLYGRPEGTRETKTSKSMIDCFFKFSHNY